MSEEIVLPKSEALEKLNSKLSILKAQADALVVKDQTTYINAASLLTSYKSFIEAVKQLTASDIAEAKERLERLKQEEAMILNPGKDGVALVNGKITSWREEEKRQAKVEEDRKNADLRRQQQEKADADRREAERIAAENKKRKIAEIQQFLKDGKIGKREAARQLKAAGAAAEAAVEDAAAAAEEAKNAPPPTATVKPNIPAVAGAPKNQTFFFGELLDSGAAIIREYSLAIHSNNAERVAFLRQFIEVSESAVGKFARKTQDDAKATSLVPGVRFWSRG